MNKLVLLLLVFVGYLTNANAATLCKKTDRTKPHYSVVIDAGSSGSRIYIYHVEPSVGEALPIIELIDQKKVEPGVSTYEANKELILLQMDSLLLFAESKVDTAYWAETELYLMATAGMRLLEKKERKQTMSELSAFFKVYSEFNFKEALILSGQYEALYGWAALNYLDDTFNPSTPRESLLEMGGASTQITYLAEQAKSKDILYRNYAGDDYSIFAKSYLEMGQDRAQVLAGVPACYPIGYPVNAENSEMGLGDFGACSKEIERIFNEICDSLDITECLFNTNFEANTENDFIAIAAFYYTFAFLEYEDTIALDNLQDLGTDFCNQTWAELKEQYPSENASRLKSYCFNASYFWTLLSQGYGFDKGTVIRTKNEIEGSDISWTLGAVIDLELGYAPERL